MERIVKKLVDLEVSFDPIFYTNHEYRNPTASLKLAVFGLLKLSTDEIREFVKDLSPLSADFFAGQKPYFILEFAYKRALEILDLFNGKKTIVSNRNCKIYAIPLNSSFSPDLPKRPLLGDISISSSIVGLQYTENYLTKTHHATLLSILDSLNWSESLNRRKVIHFGYRFDYTTSIVSMNPPIPMPSWIKEIVDGLGPCFDQITINKYSPGDGIASHVDTHSSFMNTFHIISLGSEIVMEFRNGLKQVDALLRAGSLLTVADEARYGFEHGIKPRKVDVVDGMVQDRGIRYSITVRETRKRAVCNCIYTDKCY